MSDQGDTLKRHARALRAEATDAEALLWRHLRGRRMAGLKFRRQHPLGSYIADFACVEAGLVVELDGGQHFEPQAQVADRRRTAALNRAGHAVLRFHNGLVLRETEAVLAVIHQWLAARHAGAGDRPSPPSRAPRPAPASASSPSAAASAASTTSPAGAGAPPR